MLLAKTYDPSIHNPTGWWMSEKLDGIRAVWDPVKKQLSSRNGNVFVAPDFFIKDAPNVWLDGEIWHSRNSFEKTGTIRKDIPDDDKWSELSFMIFDVLHLSEPYEKRLDFMKSMKIKNRHFKVLPVWKCESHNHLMKTLDDYEKMGAEGIMLRKPKSFYEYKRSDTLLKVKSFSDEEAVVLEHIEGKDRLVGLVGAIRVQNDAGHVFKIGSGFTDEMRKYENIPPIGSKVTYKYYQTTKNGTPRFPIFVRRYIN